MTESPSVDPNRDGLRAMIRAVRDATGWGSNGASRFVMRNLTAARGFAMEEGITVTDMLVRMADAEIESAAELRNGRPRPRYREAKP